MASCLSALLEFVDIFKFDDWCEANAPQDPRKPEFVISVA
eukprot:CAMPEP_0184047842 /NCGR_PEP_ID=MMETSP0956-20121227/2414_1 /TAXON_ID=627963 /ORGANISM="Aplanochytrium sp, Strain PBS07" /LENGTH=39 /DNA_ID= /DNA_START= /DNA_END= /DNA_ORIENTATION=